MSESVMIVLTKKGMSRQTAHELLRKLTITSELKKKPLKSVLLEDEAIRRNLTEKEIAVALNPKKYLGTAIGQVDLAVNMTVNERKARLPK